MRIVGNIFGNDFSEVHLHSQFQLIILSGRFTVYVQYTKCSCAAEKNSPNGVTSPRAKVLPIRPSDKSLSGYSYICFAGFVSYLSYCSLKHRRLRFITNSITYRVQLFTPPLQFVFVVALLVATMKNHGHLPALIFAAVTMELRQIIVTLVV